ncbi:hypothetical protein [Nocardia seriolae]|uniref:hypothetical protein n=1 Tax=Nocardia seriolae TaxID=37332 RepID=UPI0011AB3FB1|nr:hypothetical protein [Nocardia seriolae]MTK44028.1 hypothetical protein [Nocardia seriolae]QOW33470.1 hypothetical protein IMZ23_37890 [Nocardia seriolae]QUN20782.1 hypothetical protein KEC46_16935 [Nocardia seriolae]WKY53574.1 hypothetical protein Q5P07_05345 [Nocardia seriolae]
MGSLPASLDSPGKAMAFAVDTAGEFLDGMVPGCEADPYRAQWYVRPIIDRLGSIPALAPVRRGDWSTLRSRDTFRLRAGRSLTEADIDAALGYAAEARRAAAALGELRRTDPGLRLQVGIPTPFVIGFIAFEARMLRWRRGFPYYRPIVDATVREIVRIHEALRDNVVFQLELAAETLLCAGTPAVLRQGPATAAGRAIARLVARAPYDSHFGVHLCYGSLDDKPVVAPRSTAPVVALANAIARYWPAGRHLDFVHLPIGDGKQAPVRPRYYAPLARLELPGATRVVAGLAHSTQPLAQARQALAVAESAYGGQLDVAAPCGLGRYATVDRARAAVAHAVALAETVPSPTGDGNRE